MNATNANLSGSHNADIVTEKMGLLGLLHRLAPYFWKQKWSCALVVLAVVTMAIVGRVSVTIFGLAVDKGILKSDTSFIQKMAFLYLLVELVQMISFFVQSYVFAKLGNRILFQLRSELVAHVQGLPITFFEKNPTGRIVTRVTADVVSLGELFTQGLFKCSQLELASLRSSLRCI